MTDEFLNRSLVKCLFEVILISAEGAIESAYSVGGFCEESYQRYFMSLWHWRKENIPYYEYPGRVCEFRISSRFYQVYGVYQF